MQITKKKKKQSQIPASSLTRAWSLSVTIFHDQGDIRFPSYSRDLKIETVIKTIKTDLYDTRGVFEIVN